MFIRIVKKVFRRPLYSCLALFVGSVVLMTAILLPNSALIGEVLSSTTFAVPDKITFIWSLLGMIETNFTIASASYTTIIAALFGINLALLVYYIRERQGAFSNQGGMLGVGGLLSGILGIGCAACGTFVLSALVSVLGLGWLITLLPFGGQEFGYLGVVLTGYAVYWTARKIDEPLVC